LHKYIHFTSYTCRRFLLYLAHQRMISFHYIIIHHRSIVLLFNLQLPALSMWSGRASTSGTRRPEAHTSITHLSQHLRPSIHLSHICPACSHYIDAPATASVVVPHIIIIHTPRTSPRLDLDNTCARDTAPLRCARIGCRVAIGWSAMEVRDRARRTVVVVRILARRGDKTHIV
jgi:hypothetical protein